MAVRRSKKNQNQLEVVEKTVEDRRPYATPTEQRQQAVGAMMRRIFNGTKSEELGEELGVSRATVDRRLVGAREDGVPQIAREIFISEFLPYSMTVLKEALQGDDLKLAVQVALKVVAGLQIMEDPAKLEAATIASGEPESLEVWRAKFTKKSAVIDTVPIKQLEENHES